MSNSSAHNKLTNYVFHNLFVIYFVYIFTNNLYNQSSFRNQFQQPIVLFLASTTFVTHFFFKNHLLQQFNHYFHQPFFFS